MIALNRYFDPLTGCLEGGGWPFGRPIQAGEVYAVLQRLVDAYAAGTPHVNTKKLMEDTGCATPANLFSKASPWRDYLVKVKGAHAWQLHLPSTEEPLEDETTEAEALSG